MAYTVTARIPAMGVLRLENATTDVSEVGTLQQAREVAAAVIATRAGTAVDRFLAEVDALSEQGGTINLPDNTVIEVKPT